MLITLELLQNNNASQEMINYFKSLEKPELDLLELVSRCIEDGESEKENTKAYVDFLYDFATKNNCKEMFDAFLTVNFPFYYGFRNLRYLSVTDEIQQQALRYSDYLIKTKFQGIEGLMALANATNPPELQELCKEIIKMRVDSNKKRDERLRKKYNF